MTSMSAFGDVAAWLTDHGIDGKRLTPLGIDPDEVWVPGNDVRLLIRP